MSKNFQPLSSGEVLSVSSDSQFVIGHSTFRVSEFTAALKQLMLDNSIGGLTPEKIDWLTTEGIECDVLRFGSEGWVKGKVRLHLEFLEDEEGGASPDPKTEAAIEFVAPVAAAVVASSVVAETVTTDDLSFDVDTELDDSAETIVAEDAPPSGDLGFLSKETFVQKEDESFDDLFSDADEVAAEEEPEVSDDTDKDSFDSFFDEAKPGADDETLVDGGLGADFDELVTDAAADGADSEESDASDAINDLFGDDDLFAESGTEMAAEEAEEIVEDTDDEFSDASFDFDMDDEPSAEAIAPEEETDDLDNMLDLGGEVVAEEEEDPFADLAETPEAAMAETSAENSDLDGLDDFFSDELSSETEETLDELDELDEFDSLLEEEVAETEQASDDLGLDDLFDEENAGDESVLDDPFGEEPSPVAAMEEDNDFSFDTEDISDGLSFDEPEADDGEDDLDFSNPFATDEDSSGSEFSLDDGFGEKDDELSDDFSFDDFDDTAAPITDELSMAAVEEDLDDENNLLEADLPPEVDFGSTEDLGEFINVSVLRKKAATAPPKPMETSEQEDDDDMMSPFDLGEDPLLDAQQDDISLGELFANDGDDEFNFDELGADPLDSVTGDEDEVSADIWDLE